MDANEVVKLLEYYKIPNISIHGDRITCACPIHNGKNTNAFSIYLSEGRYYCFSQCGGGTILDLISQLSKCSILESKKILEDVSCSSYVARRRNYSSRQYNTPLTQNELDKIYKETLPLLSYRGFLSKTLRDFDVRICYSGRFKDRVLVPVHDIRGRIITFYTRAISDKVFPKHFPTHNYSKTLNLFNYFRIKNRNRVIVCEGEFDCMRLYEYGYQAVALSGKSLSSYQHSLLRKFKLVDIMLDGDDAGRDGTEKIYKQLKNSRIIKLSEGMDPCATDLISIINLVD